MANSLTSTAKSKVVTSLAAAAGCMVALSVLMSQHMQAGEPGPAPANLQAAAPSPADSKPANATNKLVIASGRIVDLRTTPLDLASIAITDFGDHVEPAKSETR